MSEPSPTPTLDLMDRLKREEAVRWHDKFMDALQSDLENGVKWLNEQAADSFMRQYPELNRVFQELHDASEPPSQNSTGSDSQRTE